MSGNVTTKLEGIKAIKNLIIPSGSGLKISADGEITGNFEGGGELYLDSMVCLTVGKDISGVTKLILNPKLFSDDNIDIIKNMIKGGIEHPYLIVKGSSKATETEAKAVEIESGEKRYEILAKKLEENGTTYSYYYIAEDISITDFVQITSTSIEGRTYKSTVKNEQEINITDNGYFTTDMILHYELLEDGANPNKYTNLKRELMLKTDNKTATTIPAGTEILMIKNNKYYTYIIPKNIENLTGIPLTNFKDSDGNVFVEDEDLKTVEGVTTETNETTKSITYRYTEEYKFIVSFENNETKINTGTYYAMLNIYDGQDENGQDKWIEDEQIESANTIKIQKRTYNYGYALDREKYEANGTINLTGNLYISEASGEVLQKDKDLYVKLKIFNSKNQQIDLPKGTKISINDGQKYQTENGICQIKCLENLVDTEIIQDLNILIDMTEVLPQNGLEVGEYKLQLEYILGKNDVLENTIQNTIQVPIIIINNLENKSTYGIDVDLLSQSDISEDKLQLINYEETQEREINLQYKGNLVEPKIKIEMLEKTGIFEYTNIENTENANKITVKDTKTQTQIIEITNLAESQNITLIFSENLKEGTYKIKFELYDKFDTKQTETYINFIVN